MTEVRGLKAEIIDHSVITRNLTFIKTFYQIKPAEGLTIYTSLTNLLC